MASTAIIPVPFHGDEIHAIQDEGGKVFVVIRRICEALGIDYPTQYKKLKDLHWASIGLIPTDDARGCDRELCVLPLDQLPMWLATIDVRKVGEHVREKLMRYQVEARDALARHFFGVRDEAPSVPALDPRIVQAEQIAAQGQQLVMLVRDMVRLEGHAEEARLEALRASQRAETAELKAEEAKRQAALVHDTLTGNTNMLSLVGYCRLHKLHLTEEEMARIGAKLSRKCRAEGLPIGKVHSEKWGEINSYPTDILGQYFGHGVPGSDNTSSN